MKTVIALAILCSAAYAHADDCKPTGAPVFTIDAVDRGKVTSSTKLFGNGAWTVDANGGCADKAIATKVQALLAGAPWKISHPIHCEMMTTTWTNYYASGKLLFSERACNPDQLDDASAKSLAEIVKVVGAATQPVATTCKPTGDVVFEIAKKPNGAAKVGTSTTRVYASGAVTYAEKAADGANGPAKSSCLDKDALARIVDDVKAAPWTVTTPRVRCMARSQTVLEYSVQGKVVFAKQVCGTILDEASAKKLEDIESLLAKLVP
jgi:hypothetical protein